MRLVPAVLLILSAPSLAAEPITGRPSVTDGDTLVIRDTRIRLHGIDAPESAQTCQDRAGKDYRCGQAAALALDNHIGEATVTCEPRDADQYGRTVSVCRKGVEDLNAWMVAHGHAVAFRRYSTDYVPQEQAARAARRGIWAGTFEEPSAWRRAQRGATRENQPDPVPSHSALNCQIKGNISRSSERVYHLPRSRDYAPTVIDEKAGERMFCSEDEAKAAGWRAPRGSTNPYSSARDPLTELVIGLLLQGRRQWQNAREQRRCDPSFEDAQEYLGSRLHADLVAPPSPVWPARPDPVFDGCQELPTEPPPRNTHPIRLFALNLRSII